MAAKVALTFQIQHGSSPVRSETFTQGIIKIGKATASHLRLDDESVSRMHAVVEVVDGDDGKPQVQIIDLGSARGTLVNGQKVNKTVLRNGDTISLGDTRLVLTIAAAEAAAAASPAAPPAPPPMAMAGRVPPPMAMPMPGAPPVPPPQPMAGSYASHAAMTAASPMAGAQPAMPPSGPPPGMMLPPGVQRALMSPEAVEVRDGSVAIEVTAMFQDAVLDVKHYTDPKATGKISGATKAIRAAGIGLLLVAGMLFLIQLHRAGVDEANREKKDQDKNFVYTPAEPIQALEFGWLVSLLAGMVVATMATARGLAERLPRDFRVGTTPEAEFKVPGELLPEPELPLVRSTGDSFEALFLPAMRGDLTHEGQVTPIQQLVEQQRAKPSAEVHGAYAMALPLGARLKLDLGENTFLVAAVPPPKREKKAFEPDWGFLAYLGGALAGAVILIGLMFSIPPDSKTLSGSGDDDAAQYAKYLVKPPEEKQEEVQTNIKTGKDDPGGKGQRHKGAEGKMGNKNAPNTGHMYGIKGPANNQDLHMAKMFAEKEAQQAGVLGWLNGNTGVHGPTSIFGQDSALGNDAENALGNLMGDTVGDSYGAGGLGLVGTGSGGGGTGEGTIGLGNLGTIGHGGGGGNGQGYGSGAGTLGGRHAGIPNVMPGQADVRGSLDKDLIRRAIRLHMNEFKFCYDQELQRNASLNGRVVVAFTISGDGTVIVSNVASSTMNDSAVDNCVAQAMRRVTFPKPEGGGIVQVNYPFTFKAD